MNNNTALTTHYPVNSVLLLTYTTDDGVGYWKIANYDSNTKVTQTSTTGNANYHLLMAYSTNIKTSTANTTRKNASLYYNPASGILTAPKFSGTFVGTADKASAFATAQSITLEGDVNGTSTSTGGWLIPTVLSTTGVAAGSYGLASAVTPAFGSSFNVPHIIVDAKGRITSASTYTVKLPVDTGATSVSISGSGNALTNVSYNASNRTLTFTKATYNNYTLPSATNSVRGGVKIGYSQNGKNYPVQLSNEQMFVSVPWTDTNTTYTAGTGLTLSGTTFLVNATDASEIMNQLSEGTSPAQQDDYLIAQYAGGGSTTTTYHRRKVKNIITADNVKKALGTGNGTTKYLREDGTWYTPPNTTYTSLPNPEALTIGSKIYTGSSAITITAADLGVTGAMVYKGTTSTEITDGGTQAPTIGGSSVAVNNLQAGNVVLYGSKEFVWNGSKWELLGDEGSYKVKQTVVTSPSASGDTTSFIDTIFQDANGKITATKKTVTTVSQSAAGLMSAEDKKKLDGIAAGATANTGDITGVTAGNGLTGGGSSGSVTLNVGAGEGISVTADAVALATVSGLTAGTYGPSAAVTGSNGATMNVPEITVDAYGRVTKVTNRVYTAKNNTYTSLKNPNSLIVQGNGTQSFTYDGSTAKTLNIKAGTNVSVSSDTSGNITIAATDTDTHYTTGLKVGATSTATTNAAATNGNVYLNVLDNTTVRDSHKIVGAGATTVTSDTNGVITINSTDTKYTLPTASSSTLGGVKIGSNINIKNGIISVSTADKDTAGVTIVYPAANCTSFSSDSGTITPLAAQKSAELFAITRPPKRSTGNPANPGEAGTCTTNNIVRWLNTAGDVQDSKITIEDVTNTKDTSKKAQVISIPAEGGKKMVYGYCTDQVDGTSFIGGIFDADATTYPYAQGLAIGGTSGNLLWKGKVVATTDQIPTIPTSLKNPNSLTIQGNGATLTNGVYDGSAAKTVNITASSIGAAPTSHASTATTYGAGTSSNYGHVKLSDSTSSTSAASSGIAASPKAVKTVYDAAAKLASANSFSASNTFNSATTFKGNIILDSALYGASLPSPTADGQLYFIEDNDPVLPNDGATNQILVSDASGNAKWHSIAKSTDTSKRYLVNTGSSSGLDYIESVYTQDNVLFGAAWNDYAEFRTQKEIIEPGYCVASNDNGQVYRTTEKYQACDGIVSDTYGFAIGETNNCKTPLAVAGRVLAYYEGNREDYHAGDTVCAGPEGKICKMTREEIREWPDRIIGIVSEIPEYEIWGSNNIKVNNRIWIKVK